MTPKQLMEKQWQKKGSRFNAHLSGWKIIKENGNLKLVSCMGRKVKIDPYKPKRNHHNEKPD